jgi:hypothetical protein
MGSAAATEARMTPAQVAAEYLSIAAEQFSGENRKGPVYHEISRAFKRANFGIKTPDNEIDALAARIAARHKPIDLVSIRRLPDGYLEATLSDGTIEQAECRIESGDPSEWLASLCDGNVDWRSHLRTD